MTAGPPRWTGRAAWPPPTPCSTAPSAPGRTVGLLATAPTETGAAPAATPAMPVPEAARPAGRAAPEALAGRPRRRRRGAARLGGHGAAVVYLADGTDRRRRLGRLRRGAGRGRAGDECCATRCRRRACCCRRAPRPTGWWRASPRCRAPLAGRGRGAGAVRRRPHAGARAGALRRRQAAEAEAPIVLPPELRNRLGRLVLEGQSSAGARAAAGRALAPPPGRAAGRRRHHRRRRR